MDETLYEEMYYQEERFWWFVAKRNIVLHLIDHYFAMPADRRPTACDIGCGCGALLSRLADRFDPVGTDVSPTARSFCQERGLDISDGALPDRLPFAESSLDVVVLSDVLEHVEEDAASVAAVTQCLRPGGILVCTVPAHPWMWTRRDELHHHYRRYGYDQFRNLFAGQPLQTELLSYYNVGLFVPMAAARLLLRTLGGDRARPDLAVPRFGINRLLRSVFEFEKHVLPYLSSPIGASLISVHRKIVSDDDAPRLVAHDARRNSEARDPVEPICVGA